MPVDPGARHDLSMALHRLSLFATCSCPVGCVLGTLIGDLTQSAGSMASRFTSAGLTISLPAHLRTHILLGKQSQGSLCAARTGADPCVTTSYPSFSSDVISLPHPSDSTPGDSIYPCRLHWIPFRMCGLCLPAGYGASVGTCRVHALICKVELGSSGVPPKHIIVSRGCTSPKGHSTFLDPGFLIVWLPYMDWL